MSIKVEEKSGLPISSWMSCFVNLPTTCKFHTQQRGYRSHVINTRCLCLLGTPRRDWSSEFLRDHHLRLFRCRRSDHFYHEGGGSRRLLNVLMMHTCIKNSVSEYEFGSKYKQACFLYTRRAIYASDISEKLSFCIFGTEFFQKLN